jgi:hypothetical protein
MWYLRAPLYIMIVSYLTSRLTYVTTYLRPDRPFTFDHVLYVALLGAASTAALFGMEYGVWSRRAWLFLVSAFALGIMAHGVESLTWEEPDVQCASTVAYVGLIYDDADAAQLRREFGQDVEMYRGWAVGNTTAANMTAERGVDLRVSESHRDILAHTMNTYEMLQSAYAGLRVDWIVALEAGARALPNFRARTQRAACAHADKDLVWLQGPAILRWKLTGGVVDGTTGMMYRRQSLPRVLHWLDLDGDGVSYERSDHTGEDGEGQYQTIALNHLLSAGCWADKLACAVTPLVVESVPRG